MSIKHYIVTLTTLGPLHIGSGKMLNKKDYFFYKNQTIILNPISFYKQLSVSQKKRYEDFLHENEANLNKFISENALESVALRCVSYTIDGIKVRSGNNVFHNVHQFMRDGQGSPYVPGSSLKGLIRTWILGYIISNESDKYAPGLTLRSADEKLNAIEDKLSILEKAIFKRNTLDNGEKNEEDNIMRYLSISDSNPLENRDLMFAKKYDVFTAEDYHEDKRGNSLNIYRESLKIGTKITFRMDIDESNLYFKVPNGKIVVNGTNLQAFANNFYYYYKEHFLSKFDISADQRNNIVYLGGGAGFGTKTINNQLFKDKVALVNAKILYQQFPTKISDAFKHANALRSEIRKAQFTPGYMNPRGRMKKEDHRHWQFKQFGVAPHTLKASEINNGIVEFGKCLIHIEEVKER